MERKAVKLAGLSTVLFAVIAGAAMAIFGAVSVGVFVFAALMCASLAAAVFGVFLAMWVIYLEARGPRGMEEGKEE